MSWQNHDKRHWLTEVKDQGLCGSCVAFAVCAMLETRVRIQRRDPTYQIDLSEADLFFCGQNNPNSCEDGWAPNAALSRCRETGVGFESDFPYKDEQQSCVQVPTRLPVLAYSQLKTVVDVKSAIAFRGPVIAGMTVYEDFGFYGQGVYRPTSPVSVGLHAVCIVGYDDGKGCWIIKNSWGAGFGEKGFARIGYGTCGILDHHAVHEATPDVSKLNGSSV